MQCTLLIPHLFWPGDAADAVARDLRLPAISKLLARARCDRLPAITPEAWLCQAFGIERQHDWPIAPLTLEIDGSEPLDAYWLRADPVHLKVTRDRLLLVDNTLFDLALDEARSMSDTLNRHFGEQRITFHTPQAKRWYAKLARAPELVTHPIREAAGQDVQHYLPSGAEGLAWHRIFNEVQMLLHEHPVNESREARGDPPVNSVWFWGGGTRPVVRGRPFHGVWSDNDAAIAIGAAAHSRTGAAPSNAETWLASVARSGNRSESHLIMLDAIGAAVAYHDSDAWRARIVQLDAQWLAPLLTALREGRIALITLVALGKESSGRFVASRPDLLKLWRRPQSLSAYA